MKVGLAIKSFLFIFSIMHASSTCVAMYRDYTYHSLPVQQRQAPSFSGLIPREIHLEPAAGKRVRTPYTAPRSKKKGATRSRASRAPHSHLKHELEAAPRQDLARLEQQIQCKRALLQRRMHTKNKKYATSSGWVPQKIHLLKKFHASLIASFNAVDQDVVFSVEAMVPLIAQIAMMLPTSESAREDFILDLHKECKRLQLEQDDNRLAFTLFQLFVLDKVNAAFGNLLPVKARPIKSKKSRICTGLADEIVDGLADYMAHRLVIEEKEPQETIAEIEQEIEQEDYHEGYGDGRHDAYYGYEQMSDGISFSYAVGYEKGYSERQALTCGYDSRDDEAEESEDNDSLSGDDSSHQADDREGDGYSSRAASFSEPTLSEYIPTGVAPLSAEEASTSDDGEEEDMLSWENRDVRTTRVHD